MKEMHWSQFLFQLNIIHTNVHIMCLCTFLMRKTHFILYNQIKTIQHCSVCVHIQLLYISTSYSRQFTAFPVMGFWIYFWYSRLILIVQFLRGGGESEMAQVHFKETNCLHTSVIYVNDFLRNSRKHWYQPRNEPRPPCLTTLTTNTWISQVFVHIFIRNHIQW